MVSNQEILSLIKSKLDEKNEVIREQQEMIQELQGRLATLETKLSELEALEGERLQLIESLKELD